MSTSLGHRSWRRLRAACLQLHGDVCHLCGQPGADTADHLIPRSAGGLNQLENLRPAHATCNSKRQDMSLSEWFRRYPLATTGAAPSRRW